MNALTEIAPYLEGFLPLGAAAVGTILALWVAHRLMERRARIAEGSRLQKQALLLGLAVLGLVVIVLALPVSSELRGQLLSFLGIVLSAAIALSSTTLLGNVLASVMLRTIRGFRMGDFIRVGEHFGRVSERGLFHTELQTEDRDLVTLPNLYLVTHPVVTVRSSGTIIAATVSLGYDAPRARVEALLLEAAQETKLEEPFVQVLELGDYSVTYRIAGMLTDVSRLISTRSRLRAAAMDALHRGGIEIVSPTFMNQRVYPEERRFIPDLPAKEVAPEVSGSPEDTVFDKAEHAEELEQLQIRYRQLQQNLEQLRGQLKEVRDPAEKERVQRELDQRKEEQDELAARIERRKEPEGNGSQQEP